ncbi:Chagasin family peptidase inhibitor I42 [Flavobacterium fontis]|uniref:Chagasin family peptidase inhibitor I42 n=1 Tax=Flavobacterium fontis TaxID=1124188 RepID=A0A1M5E324_9FLAO|nr:protease inhibitor I42 family protein [Flavobacterium fontis]SHF73596.1 Chagasin family peptidase inhibitor I42 [Flavobacterium fontis]
MKKLKIILPSLILILIVISTIYYFDKHNYYEPGENDSFRLKVGETFSVKLYENPTTGYSNCVLNENAINCIEIVKESYEADWNTNKIDGNGGEFIVKFKAVKKGIDTIKIGSCPTFKEGKTCKDFNTIKNQTDNKFYVTVE